MRLKFVLYFSAIDETRPQRDVKSVPQILEENDHESPCSSGVLCLSSGPPLAQAKKKHHKPAGIRLLFAGAFLGPELLRQPSLGPFQ